MGCGSSRSVERDDEPRPKKERSLFTSDAWSASHVPFDFATGLGRDGPNSILRTRTDSYHAAMGNPPTFDSEGRLVRSEVPVFPYVPVPNTLRLVFILGKDTAVRQVQSKRVASALSMTRLDVNDMILREMTKDTKWGLIAADYVKAGSDVPPFMLAYLICHSIRTQPNQEGFVLDGYPRTSDEAVALEAVGIDFNLVVMITDHTGEQTPFKEMLSSVRVDHTETVNGMLSPDTVFSHLCSIAREFGACTPVLARTVDTQLVTGMATLVAHIDQVSIALAWLTGGVVAGLTRQLEVYQSEVGRVLAQFRRQRDVALQHKGLETAVSESTGHGMTRDELMATPWEGPASIGACIDYLYHKKLEEGFFRVPGNKTTVDGYHDAFEAGQAVDLSVELDPAAIASLLKKEAKHHHFPLDEANARSLVAGANESGVVDTEAVARAITAMDHARAVGLRKLVALLSRVIEHRDVTKMSSGAVAIATGPTFFPSVSPKLYPSLLTCLRTDTVWSGLS
eukprot:m.187095 g.187095  ORF g.187095 m.187095 type:complete len:510 (-) comp16978_c0_seq1:102-1631(-)